MSIVEDSKGHGSWLEKVFSAMGIGEDALHTKIRGIVGPTQAALQDQIDNITANYVLEHPNFVAVAIAKDAKLKSKPREIVEAMLTTYPGVIAIAVHEVAHKLHNRGGKADIIDAERLASAAKSRTGIDISPATHIGENFFVDHGTATVIGETAEIGDNTQIMHKVTLGAFTNPQETRPEKLAHRHPKIGDDCFLSVGVEVLGNVQVRNRVTLGPKAMVFGNHITIHDDVKIGSEVKINDHCEIAKGVTIGSGAFIHKGTGLITNDVPSNSEVFKDEKGNIQIIDGAETKHKKNGNGIDHNAAAWGL